MFAKSPAFMDEFSTGWCFGTLFIFLYIGNVIIPTDFHIFSEGWLNHQAVYETDSSIQVSRRKQKKLSVTLWWSQATHRDPTDKVGVGAKCVFPVKTRGVSNQRCSAISTIFFKNFINIYPHPYLCLISSSKTAHVWNREQQWKVSWNIPADLFQLSQGKTRRAKSSAGRSDLTGPSWGCFFLGFWSHTTIWLFNVAMENGPFIDDFPS